jgi:hypothetical protein
MATCTPCRSPIILANLNRINAGMAATERQHFQQWKSVN